MKLSLKAFQIVIGSQDDLTNLLALAKVFELQKV